MKMIFSLALLIFFTSPAFADLAPGPEDPCYQVQDGGKCTTEEGKPGTCVKNCFDRLNPGTGEKMYTSCNTSCRPIKKTPNDDAASDKNKEAAAPPQTTH